MANLIQIKRSTTADAPTAGSLITGELAYSLLNTSNSLFVGDGSNNAIRIGGGKYLWLHQANVSAPGALTANAVVITNGNGYVTEWKTNKLIIGTDGSTINVTSISATANSTQLGASAGGSNTEFVTSYAIKTYVDGYVNDAKPIVTSTQVGFGNTSNRLASSADFTFDEATDKITVGNSTVNTTVSPAAIAIGNSTINTTVNSTGIAVTGTTDSTSTLTGAVTIAGGLGVAKRINAGSLAVGNTTVYSSMTGTSVSTIDVFATGTVNASTLSVGGWVVANTSGVTTSGLVSADVIVAGGTAFRANTTQATVTVPLVTTNISSNSQLTVGSNVVVNTSAFFVGNSTVNTVIDSAAITTTATIAAGNTTITGFITSTGTVNATALNIGANVNLTTTEIDVGNTTTNSVLTSTSIKVGTATVNTVISGTAIDTDGTLAVLGATTLSNTLSVAGLATLSTANVTSTVNIVGAATVNGAFTVNNTAALGNTTITGSATMSTANVTSSLNIIGAATVNGALTVNNTAAIGNTTITGFANVSSTLQVSGNASFAQNASVTGHLSVGTFQTGDATISGNLTITGTLTTVSANNITVTDPLIQLASNNTTSDVLDIGFFGSYEAGDAGVHEHTGLFRDASDGGVYKLFQNLEPSPTTTVDTANATFEIATLQAFLKTGGAGASGLIANSTTIALTANSTLNVAIVANTLTLSSPLVGTSGGTGLNSFTAEDILVANSSNGFRKLSKGTEGTVLQIDSGVVAYRTLDGGTF